MSIKRAALGGVLYAEDFDAPTERAPVQPPAPVIIEPVFSLAELQAAKLTARDEADQALRLALDGGMEQARRSALDAIGLALADADRAALRLAEDAADAVARGVLSMLSASLPALMARHALPETRAIARAVLPHLVAEPRISLRVHNDLADAMREEIARLDPDVGERVALLPSANVKLGDIRIGWQDGNAQRDTEAIWDDIKRALAPLGLLDPPPLRHNAADMTAKETELVE